MWEFNGNRMTDLNLKVNDERAARIRELYAASQVILDLLDDRERFVAEIERLNADVARAHRAAEICLRQAQKPRLIHERGHDADDFDIPDENDNHL